MFIILILSQIGVNGTQLCKQILIKKRSDLVETKARQRNLLEICAV